MIYGAKRTIAYLLGRDIAGRSLAVFPDDTFIVSYPRSGNTWTRFLVANLLHPNEPATFLNIERLVPDSEAQSSRYLKSIPRPRIIKSHQYFDHRYPRVIYIVRDPRDVVLSYYDFERKYRHIDDDFPVETYVRNFVNGKLSSADWGTWAENVGSWISTRNGRDSFLLLRYEDLIENTALAVKRMATFFGIAADEGRVKIAVSRSSAQRMRELEQQHASNWVTTKNKRADIPFVGTAVSGVWRSKLSPARVAEIEAVWGPLMVSLGYELMTRPNNQQAPPFAHDLPLALTREQN